MITEFFATKIGMGQVWTKSGQRLAVTRLVVGPHALVAKKNQDRDGRITFTIGYGQKKLKNMTKPLKTILEKSGFSFGIRQLREVKVEAADQETLNVGQQLAIDTIVKVGDVVKIQGITKGKGHAGVVKRHGFKGGPRTHGQTDRERAPGAIGNRTTPGRVFKGMRMAGQMGNVSETVKNLQVIFFNPDSAELWVSGPVPGAIKNTLRLTVTGHSEFEGLDEKTIKNVLKVDEKKRAAKVEEKAAEKVEEVAVEEATSATETSEQKE